MILSKGFAEITSTLVIVLMVVIMALVATVWVQTERLEGRDKTIEEMKQEKVGDKAKAENKTFEVEHETIGKAIEKPKNEVKIDDAVGTHTIHIRGLH